MDIGKFEQCLFFLLVVNKEIKGEKLLLVSIILDEDEEYIDSRV